MNDLSDREEQPERPVEVDGTAYLFKALGKIIKVLRERAGLQQKELAALVHVGEDLVSSIERGVRTPQPDFLENVDRALGAGGVLLAAVPDVREALKRARTRHPDWFRDFAKAEADANALHYFGYQGVPGMLQTENHARAIFVKRRPLLDESTIEKRVADRLARQQIFERWPSPTFSFVLDHSLLMRPVGGPKVHAEQLRRLLEIGRLRTVELQVMPFGQGEHPAMEGSFTLLNPKGRQQVAYTETYNHPNLITDPEQVRIYAERYGIIRAQALTPHESLTLIEKTLGER
ncbi:MULTISPECIES: helix-turn-helix transcriptional regulator [unclassified Streptomyces]|uniref:helix-turn-helix domain-containing protein n=1 Tax=unclassified Streptomyces TaxID=2593676 RepID=UPI001BE5DC8F|nr:MULTISPECIES: helix-turn-helix transcriptional regulator [unclassified Streptomyces]MBT2405649.1 helix-turn-helix transcriptional regulator [Streptomyces sp. ISL-21]MBT2609994.1 helix-turn-helix transcriptional regulator [Streptomyces sp. ISL-87]